MITVNSSKQQALDAEFRAIQQINFTANLDRLGKNLCNLSLLKKQKKTVLHFSQGT